MRKYIYAAILILTITLSCLQTAFASHAAGGELLYTWISDSTYRVVFKFYRDCGGTNAPQSMPLCINNPCTNKSFTSYMSRSPLLGDGRPNGSEVSLGCPLFKSNCQLPGSQLLGYREWWYEDTIKLTGKCSNWRMAISISARNNSMNIQNLQFLHIEATLNNLDVNNNSSPQFHTKPVPYVCKNSPYVYNNGAIDTDKDSLAFETIIPLVSSSCSASRAQATFVYKTPLLSLPDNPFQTNNTYKMNPVTGNISFTPGEFGPQTTTIVVKEYRQGILVGSTMRDIQVQVYNCTTPPSQINVDTTTFTDAVWLDDIVQTCINTPLKFCFDIKSSDNNTILAISDNHKLATPGATLTYSNNASSSVRGCFSWTPTAADSGLSILTVTAKDSTCNAPGVTVAQTFTIPIKINATIPPPLVTTPVTICQYSPPVPLTANGFNLHWYNMPTGGSGSLSAPQPDASNIDTQRYYVSQKYFGCTSPRVPIDVVVIPGPIIDLLASEDTVCANIDVTLSNSSDSMKQLKYTWHSDSSNFRTGKQQPKVSLSWPSSGIKVVTLSASNDECTSVDSTEIYIRPTPLAFFNTDKNVCIDSLLTVSPLKQEAQYKWTITDFSINETNFKPEHKLTWSSTGKKYIRLSLTNGIGCDSTYKDSITVRPYPVARIQPIVGDVCKNIPFIVKGEDGEYYTYSWQPSEAFTDHTGQYTKAVSNSPIYIHMRAANQWHCSSTDSMYVEPQPCCNLFMPDAFSPNNDGLNDRYWSPYLAKVTIDKLVIVDRWGQIVYSTDKQTKGWDGTNNGQPVTIGTYYYFIKYFCNGTDSMFKKGTLTLLR